MMCPKCFSDNIEPLANRLTPLSPYHEYECADCGAIFEDTLTDYQEDRDREWDDLESEGTSDDD